MSSQREKRKNKCSTCGRPSRDHPGPAGKKCSNFPLSSDEDSSLKDYPGKHKGAKDSVLRELADQLGQLTLSIRDIQDDLVDVKQDLKDVRSQDVRSPKPGTPTGSRPPDYLSGIGTAANAAEAHHCLPSGAKVSAKVLAQAKCGEYINLADFAPCLEPSLVTETSIVDGELVFKPKRNIKNMDSFLLWSMAWRAYEKLLVTYNPALYPGMCAYRIFIQTCAAKHWWPSVYSYDVRNRAKHSMEKSFLFHHLDNDIYVTTMDATTIKPNVRQCSRCKSIWHVSRDCPFSEEGAWRRLHARRIHRQANRTQQQGVRPTQRPSPSKYAITGTPAGVTTQGVPGVTSVNVAEVAIPCLGVQIATSAHKNSQLLYKETSNNTPVPHRVTTLFRRDAWVEGLTEHPNREFADKLIKYIDEGVPLLYEGPLLDQTFPNWDSCLELKQDVEKSMLFDISKSWKVGPFPTQPFSHFVSSPMGAFAKPSTTAEHNKKIRVIHDLSWPLGGSVNSHIPEQLCSVQYVTINSAVDIVKKKGVGCLMAKLDLEHAYKQIGVRPSDWHLLGTTWVNDSGQTDYYFDTVLPFGGRSSASLFNSFADGIEFIMKRNGASSVIHYLDDLFTAGEPDTTACQRNMTVMLDTCDALGVAVNPRKIVGPATVLEFLGIIIDSNLMELRISPERLKSIKAELLWWMGRKTGTKRALLSLIGKLVFISRVIQPGRTFLRRLITLSMRIKQLNHKVKLNNMARADVQWWLACVDKWNGRSVFLDDLWTTSADIGLYTDASGCGIGGVFRDLWFAQHLTPAQQQRSIAWKELYAVVVACRRWGAHFKGQRILLHCDNQSVVAIVNSGTSKCELIMTLVRLLFDVAVSNNFDLKLIHVPGVENVAADMLSRGRVKDYLALFTNALIDATFPSNIGCSATNVRASTTNS